jgi:hypothetical protein
MKIKTAVLTGAALDWAVCKALGLSGAEPSNNPFMFKWEIGAIAHYSTVWAQGGPIIERERVGLVHCIDFWEAQKAENVQYGPTPLIAAMRCFVASKLGDEVNIPDGLGDAVATAASSAGAQSAGETNV